MGSHDIDPQQMAERDKEFYEYKLSHSEMDMSALIILEKSMMLRILVFLMKGTRTSTEMYNDGQFYHRSDLIPKLMGLADIGLINMDPQKEKRKVSLTPKGYVFAQNVYDIMMFIKKQS